MSQWSYVILYVHQTASIDVDLLGSYGPQNRRQGAQTDRHPDMKQYLKIARCALTGKLAAYAQWNTVYGKQFACCIERCMCHLTSIFVYSGTPDWYTSLVCKKPHFKITTRAKNN